jgi:hypothetical protein
LYFVQLWNHTTVTRKLSVSFVRFRRRFSFGGYQSLGTEPPKVLSEVTPAHD